MLYRWMLEISDQSNRITYSKVKAYERGIWFNEALEQIKKVKKINGKDGVLAPLIKQLTEVA